MLIALGAAGGTLAVVVGIIGIPVVDACSDDPRGVVTCLRDMADRKFDLPGTIPGQVAEVAPAEVPAEQVTVIAETETPAATGGPLEAPAVEPIAEPVEAAAVPAPMASPASEAEPAEAAPPEAGPTSAAAPAAIEMALAPEPKPLTAEPELTPELQSKPAEDTPLTWSAPVSPADGSALPEQPAAPPQESAPQAEEPAAQTSPIPSGPTPPPEAATPAPQPEPTATPPQVPLELANAEPATSQATPPAIAAPVVLAPTIDAIELDAGQSFVSGSGPAGALMRLYADGQLIGESPVEEGRWLIEGQNLLDAPRRELRVEAIEPETGRLLGHATITVEIELPGAIPSEERPAEPPEFGSSVAPADSPGTAPEAQAELPESVVPAAPEPQVAEAAPSIAPSPEPAPIVPDPLPELAAVTPSRESASVEILAPSDLQPTVLPPAAATEDDPATITLAPPDAPALIADLDVPTPKPAGQPVTILHLLPFGDPDEGRYNVGKAIIRRGDTLWSIARRYYGHGIHYRTIFHANRDLIRRPSRIFPGQIFDLPLVTDD